MPAYIRKLLYGLIALKLVIGTVAAFTIAPWQGHEPDYYNVIRFVIQEQRLPGQDDYENPHLSQATHPPLYPLVAMSFVAAFDSGDLPVPPLKHPSIVCDGGKSLQYTYALSTDYNPPIKDSALGMVALRLLNLVFMTVSMIILFLTGLIVFSKKPLVALFAAAFFAFEPTLFFLGVKISNESLLFVFVTINLYTITRLLVAGNEDIPTILGFVISAILAALTKMNGLGLVLIVGITFPVLVFTKYQGHLSWRTRGLILAGIVFMVIVIGGANYLQTGNPLGRYQNLDTMVWNGLSKLSLVESLAGLRDTLGDLIRLPVQLQREKIKDLYSLGLLTLLLHGIVFLIFSWIRNNQLRLSTTVLAAYIGVSTVMVVVRASILTPAANPTWAYVPFRYHIIGIPALMLAISGGLVLWKDTIFRLLGSFCLLLWIGIVTLTTSNYVQSYAAVNQVAILDDTSLARFDSVEENVPQILGIIADWNQEDGVVNIVMDATVTTLATVDYVGRITLTDQNGLQTQCEFIPRDGHYGTTRWEPNIVINTDLIVPNCASTVLEGPLTLDMAWLDGETVFNVAQTELEIDNLPRSRHCTSNLGVFDDVYQVAKYNAPAVASPNEVYLPSVNWYVRKTPINTELTRVYRLIYADDSAVEYRCSGQPRLGMFPFSRWTRGSTIFFDECTFAFPANAPVGLYSVWVGLEDSNGNYLPLTFEGANPQHADSDWLQIGEVSLIQ